MTGGFMPWFNPGGNLAKHHLLGFESRNQPLLSQWAFAKRLAMNFGAALLLIGVSLLGGMAGYRYFEGMDWIDAFANASMILSGMGPLNPLQTWGGKLFAGFYSLYSGLALILAIGIIFAPVVHRVLHRFHLEMDD
jgi:hypothetical protein